ncbi:LysR substrate-binding domain-containing protein [Hylemonella gracilis]|uniref:LysR substrate-binding domain-containing protein n=1 Tax=Hylemonella gracilis TaxID=80880 RepID=UPI0013F165D4
MNPIRQRPLSVGPLRAFEAVARRASFRAAAEELHLTQPAISRQIRSLEEELGAPLFLRGTRHVELTGAGATLLRAIAPMLDRLDASVRHIRTSQGRRHVSLTTFASFASLWLLPRLADFQNQHPDIDIRISANDVLVGQDDPELDLGLRYCHPNDAPPNSTLLFGEVLSPVINPSLPLRQAKDLVAHTLIEQDDHPSTPLRQAKDLARHTLIEQDDHQPSAEYLSWRRWLREYAPPGTEPRGWIYLNYTSQQIQAAMAGQGVTLARMAMITEALARGELVEPFGPTKRLTSPYAYWLVRWPGHGKEPRPEVQAFIDWLLAQAAQTRACLGRRHVTLSTSAAFASYWLLPRMADFQSQHPDIDVRVLASDAPSGQPPLEPDLALRYELPDDAPANATLLFAEVLTPVASPSLPARQTKDLARQTLIELEEDPPPPGAELLSWRRWLGEHAPTTVPRHWVRLNHVKPQIEAATAGEGIALARMALVTESLAHGELVEPFGPAKRLAAPQGYWLVRGPGQAKEMRSEVQAFMDWLQAQAAQTRAHLET